MFSLLRQCLGRTVRMQHLSRLTPVEKAVPGVVEELEKRVLLSVVPLDRQIVAPPGASGFAIDFAVKGQRLVVGAPNEGSTTISNPSGAAYLFDPNSGSLVARLANPGTVRSFGNNVALTDSRALVRGNGPSGSSSIVLATFGSGAGQFQQATSIAGSGEPLATDGIWAVVGDHRFSVGLASSIGIARILNLDTGATYTTSNPGGGSREWDEFGYSVAASAGRFAVYARGDDDSGVADAGAVHVFSFSSGGLIRSIYPPTGRWFGSAMALEGDRLFITSGSASGTGVLEYQATTGALVREFLPSDGITGNGFGGSIAVDGARLLVGASGDDQWATNAGAAYLYDRATGTPLAKLFPPVPAANAGSLSFGQKVGIDGNVMAMRSGSSVFVVGPREIAIEALDAVGNPTASTAVLEGGVARFRISRVNMLERPLRVYFNVSGEADPADYQGGALANGFVDIPQGQSSVTIELPLNSDGRADVENQFQNERIIISLDTDPIAPGQQGNPTGDLIRDANGRWVPRPGGSGAEALHSVNPSKWQATVEIIDIDAKYVKVESSNATGGELSGDLFDFSIVRGGDLSTPLTVALDLSGTAVVDDDYVLSALDGAALTRVDTLLSVTVPAGQSAARVSGVPINDSVAEGVEWVHVELLERPQYTLTTDPAKRQVRMGVIDDDMPSVMLESTATVAREQGTQRALFKVNRGNIAYTNTALIANIAIGGPATTASAADYVLERVNRDTNGAITGYTPLTPTADGFYAILLGTNASEVELAVRPVDDDEPERDERLEVRLISGESYLNHPTLDRVEIMLADNDRPIVTIVAEDPLAREGADSATFLLGRSSQGLSQPLTVRYAIDTASTAVFGADYSLEGPGVSADGLSVTFAPGVDVARVTLKARRDAINESAETVTLRLLPMNGYEVGTSALTPSSATVIIEDPAPSTTYASFDWSMRPRYGLNWNGDSHGRIDLPNTPGYVQGYDWNPSSGQFDADGAGFWVDLNAGGSQGAIANYAWSILKPDGTSIDLSGQNVSVKLVDDTTYTVTLTVSGANGTHTDQQLVHVNNILVLGMGDSFASGEGNPEVRRNNNPNYLFEEFAQLGVWADGGSQSMDNWHHAAHRSTKAGFALVAADMEQADPKTSVTFVHVAQSGAEITDGLVSYDPHKPLKGKDGFAQNPTPQLAFAKSIIGDRRIDKALISIGVNDIGFSHVIESYVKRFQIGTLFNTIGVGHTVDLDDIRDELRQRVAELPARYALLDQQLRSVFASNDIGGKIVLAGYPEVFRNELGQIDTGTLSDVDAGMSGGLKQFLYAVGLGAFVNIRNPPLQIDFGEAMHAMEHAYLPLISAQRAASAVHGWQYVPATDAWLTKGYPANIRGADSFFRTVNEARRYQGGNWKTGGDGAVHPNEQGHRALADGLNAAMGALALPGAVLPAVSSVIEGQSTTIAVATSGSGLRYEWDLNFDGTFEPASGLNGTQVGFSAADLSYPATRQVAVRVTDPFGRVKFATTHVRVLNGTSGRLVNEVPSVNAGEPFRLGLERIRQSVDPANHWRVDWGDGTSELIPGDWTSRSKVYSLAAGESQRTFNYRVWLTDAGGEIEVQGGSVSVVKDDPFPRVSVQAIDAVGDEQTGNPIVFRFTRPGQLHLPLSIALGFSNGPGRAINGVDFTGPTGLPIPLSVFFPAGQSTVDVQVLPVRDGNENEGTENVDVTILPSSLYAIVTPTASAVIHDGPSIERGGIEGLVFDDANGDGEQDDPAVEPALAGWSVVLDLNSNGQQDVGEPVAVTDSAGRFVHSLQPPGSYQLVLLPQSGWASTSSATQQATVLPGETTSGLNFGVGLPVTVAGRVFSDLNINGIQDPGEQGRPSVAVWADLNGNGQLDPLEPSTLTGSDGNYVLTGVRPGAFVVRAATGGNAGTTNGIDAGGLALTAQGGAMLTAIDHGQRALPPQMSALTIDRPSVGPTDTLTLTASGVDPWTTAVRFFRESNGQLGLQHGPGGDLEIGRDEVAGDGWSWSFRAGLNAGGYLFYGVADDGNGITGNAQFAFASITSSAAPTQVGIRALTSRVREDGTLAAQFEVFRTGHNAEALTVNLQLVEGAGRTTNGVDHGQLPASIVIPAGQDSVLVTVGPIDDGAADGGESIELRIQPGSGYAVAASSSAQVAVDDASAPSVISVLQATVAKRGSTHVVNVALDANVAQHLATVPGSFEWLNVASGTTLEAAMEFDWLTGVASFAVPGAGGGSGALPPTVYRLRISGTTADSAGRLMDGNGDGTGGDDYNLTFSLVPGDLNNDGVVNNLDIAPFVLGLTAPTSYADQYGFLPTLAGDINNDGSFNNLDIAPFVSLLTGSRNAASSPPPARLTSGNPFSGRPLGVLSLPTDDDVLGSSRQTAAVVLN